MNHEVQNEGNDGRNVKTFSPLPVSLRVWLLVLFITRIMMNCAEKRKKLKAKPKVKNAEDKRKRKERVLRKIQRVSDELVVLRERYENRIVSLFDFAIETAQ
jgi:hypothetical protein